MNAFVVIKYIFKFSIKYLKYIYYGLKQRFKALFSLNLSIFGFIKSLFKLPIECWLFTKLELKYG